MSEKYILYVYFTLEQTWENQSSFCIFKDKTNKKVDAAQFLDARGDEKQATNLERPKSQCRPVFRSGYLFVCLYICLFDALNICRWNVMKLDMQDL